MGWTGKESTALKEFDDVVTDSIKFFKEPCVGERSHKAMKFKWKHDVWLISDDVYRDSLTRTDDDKPDFSRYTMILPN